MSVTVNGNTYLASADGKIYGQYPAGNAPVASEFPYDSTRLVVAGAYHVDPVNGSDANDGILVADGGTGPWQTINTNLATLAAGDTMYLRDGTHLVSSLNTKFGHTSGTLGNMVEITSYPGEEPVINCNNGQWLSFENLDYWKFSHLRVVDWSGDGDAGAAWMLGNDIGPTNCEWYSIEGETQYGGDNVGMISRKHGTSLSLDRIKVTLTVDPSTVHINTGGIYITNLDDSVNNDITINHLEVYNFQMGLYFKHGDRAGISSNLADVTVSNSFFEGSVRNSCGFNQSGVKFDNCIFSDDLGMSEADGGEGGDWNWYDHCTFYANANLRDQLTGATNNKFTNSIITTLDIKGSSSVTSDSDYNLFVNNIEDGVTSRDLASWQTANSSDANSLQGTPTYAGSDFSLIASYALAAGSTGENASSTATDIGADVSLVGVNA